MLDPQEDRILRYHQMAPQSSPGVVSPTRSMLLQHVRDAYSKNIPITTTSQQRTPCGYANFANTKTFGVSHPSL